MLSVLSAIVLRKLCLLSASDFRIHQRVFNAFSSHATELLPPHFIKPSVSTDEFSVLSAAMPRNFYPLTASNIPYLQTSFQCFQLSRYGSFAHSEHQTFRIYRRDFNTLSYYTTEVLPTQNINPSVSIDEFSTISASVLRKFCLLTAQDLPYPEPSSDSIYGSLSTICIVFFMFL